MTLNLSKVPCEAKTFTQIRVGDIICVEDGDEFPCDMVLLATSNKNGRASVMTANLDGETNLKHRFAPSLTRHLKSQNINDLVATIECQNPDPDLTTFVGNLKRTDLAQGVCIIELVNK